MVSTLNAQSSAPEKVQLSWTVLLASLWMLTVDAFTGVGFGPVSASGALTFAGAAVCLMLSPMIFLSRHFHPQGFGREPNRRPSVPLALTLFVFYIVFRVIFDVSMAGLQNVAVLISFVILIGLTSVSGARLDVARVGKWLRRSAVIASGVAIVAELSGATVYGNRTFALAAIVFLAILVPHRSKNGIARFAPLLPFVAIALSLSRVALAIGAVLLMFLAVRTQRGARLFFSMLFLGGGSAALMNWIIDNYPPLQQRFFEAGDGGLVIGGIVLNTSGRSKLWETVTTSAMESPLFGHGAGSATELVSATYGKIAHPHNDYLRLFHDYGYVGLVLFCLGYIWLIAQTLRRAVVSTEPMHWSAVLGLFAVAIAAVTDNVLIYPYAMIPLGVVVGASLAMPVDHPKVEGLKPNLKSNHEVRILTQIAKQERLRKAAGRFEIACDSAEAPL